MRQCRLKNNCTVGKLTTGKNVTTGQVNLTVRETRTREPAVLPAAKEFKVSRKRISVDKASSNDADNESSDKAIAGVFEGFDKQLHSESKSDPAAATHLTEDEDESCMFYLLILHPQFCGY